MGVYTWMMKMSRNVAKLRHQHRIKRNRLAKNLKENPSRTRAKRELKKDRKIEHFEVINTYDAADDFDVVDLRPGEKYRY